MTRIRKYRAFTLIELLVVVTIIALLLSILLPSLGRARELARRVTCASNINGLGKATLMYTQDYDGMLPMYIEDPARTDAYNACFTYRRWGGKKGTMHEEEQRLINKYVGREGDVDLDDAGVLEIFRCPDDVGAMESAAGYEGHVPTTFDCFGSSYFYNSSANGSWWDGVTMRAGLQGMRISDVRKTQKVVMANDWPFNCYLGCKDPFQYIYWHNTEELGWGNVVFVDGHVGYLQATLDDDNYLGWLYGHGWDFRPDM